ncbi:unnamed protein product [Blumeria hordei]|uniref:Uncharacterized protein n=1 Tax=Blumeria hordei TaxID=2867405 RepID=A0A383UNP1_BLUHO|nr:unnamed protein product [Blumeria hordei]
MDHTIKWTRNAVRIQSVELRILFGASVFFRSVKGSRQKPPNHSYVLVIPFCAYPRAQTYVFRVLLSLKLTISRLKVKSFNRATPSLA